jgi:hypothetical protein
MRKAYSTNGQAEDAHLKPSITISAMVAAKIAVVFSPIAQQ